MRFCVHEAGHLVMTQLLGGEPMGASFVNERQATAWTRGLQGADKKGLLAAGHAAEVLYAHCLARMGLPVDWNCGEGDGQDRRDHAEATGLTGLAAEARFNDDVQRAIKMLQSKFGAVYAV